MKATRSSVGCGPPCRFAREILTAIRTIPLRHLAEVTGLSLRYYALIRAGERVPRPHTRRSR
jgi:hypothetical protein